MRCLYLPLVLYGIALGSLALAWPPDTPQYLVDVSHRADGQLEFTPSTLTNVPLGAVILFVAPANVPFNLYQAPYDPPQDMCISKKKVNQLPETYHAVVMRQPSAAHFACSALSSDCTCDGASLFMVNPVPGITRSAIRSHMIGTSTGIGSLGASSPSVVASASVSLNGCH